MNVCQHCDRDASGAHNPQCPIERRREALREHIRRQSEPRAVWGADGVLRFVERERYSLDALESYDA